MPRRKAAAPGPGERRSTDYAYERIREQIISGAIPAGSPVSQASLAEELGVSRTPLREATRLLQNEGLLVGERNQRLRVAAVSLPDLDQLYAIRIATEAMAVRLAVPLMDDAHRAKIDNALETMNRIVMGTVRGDFDRHHREFHRLLVAPAGERFEAVSDTLWDHTIRYRSAYLSATGDLAATVKAAQAEHGRIAAAATAGDADGAAQALVDHYARTAQTIFDSADPDYEAVAMKAAIASAGRPAAAK